MIDSIATKSSSLSQLFQKVVLGNWAMVVYRLPGHTEPVCIVQTNGTAERLADPLDALGKKGFVIAPWSGDAAPALLVKADYSFYGWDPDAGMLEVSTLNGQGKQDELPTPTAMDAPFEEYQQQVTVIQEAIANGIIEKAILSRIVSHELPQGFDAVEALKTACQKYPNAFCYLVYVPGIGQWLGATPEVLVNVQGSELRTVALAGTKSNNQLINKELNWSIKELHEHELVRIDILRLLQKYTEQVTADGPNTIQAGNLYHLRTDFTSNT